MMIWLLLTAAVVLALLVWLLVYVAGYAENPPAEGQDQR